MDRIPVLPIPQVKHHLVDPVAAFGDLLASSPTTYPDRSLLTIRATKGPIIVTVAMLAQGLKIMLEALEMNPKLCFLHSMRRGGATAPYREGVTQIDIKHH